MQPQPRSDILKSMNSANINSPEIVTTPTFEWLAAKTLHCRNELLIGSPYVTDALLELSRLAPKGVSKRLVTRTKMGDFKMGMSSLDAICAFAEEGARVYSLNNLHAKIYVFDESTALVTSANATQAGLRNNLECGLATSDAYIARQLSLELMSGFNNADPPRRMKLNELQDMRNPLGAVSVEMPETEDESEAEPVISAPDSEAFLNSFTGWNQIALRGALSFSGREFETSELYQACRADAKRQYPMNKNPNAKLRQQLQFLRDMGLIEFVEGKKGWYRLLVK